MAADLQLAVCVTSHLETGWTGHKSSKECVDGDALGTDGEQAMAGAPCCAVAYAWQTGPRQSEHIQDIDVNASRSVD